MPWTLFSVGLALLISFVLGIALGTIMAYKRDTWIDHLLSNLAAMLDAISPYLIGLLAILFFGIIWKLVPIMEMRGAMSSGMKPGFTIAFLADIFKHVRVLLLVYVLSSIGSWMLQMKSNTVATLGEDYVTVARARGLTDGRILTAYVGRNATLPLFTQTGHLRWLYCRWFRSIGNVIYLSRGWLSTGEIDIAAGLPGDARRVSRYYGFCGICEPAGRLRLWLA